MHRPLHERLGYSSDDRLLIIHADDVGMCEATVSAWRELLDFGLLTSASTMAPCSWFPAAAQLAKEYGERADLGLHLTLNCEWPNYRWSPISGNDAETGLVDDTGYFHTLAKATHEQAKAGTVRRELQAQIDRARRAGLDLTHFDSHMITLWHPALTPIYIELAVENRQPALIARRTAEQLAKFCVIPLDQATQLAEQFQFAEEAGHILPIDSWYVLPFGRHTDIESRMKWACERLDRLEPGVHALIGHPAKDTPELRAIAPDFETRIGDQALLTSEAFQEEVMKRGFKLIGLREIRDLFREEQRAWQ